MGIYFYFKVFICFSQIIRLHPISRCDAPAPILLRRIGPMRNVNLDFKNYLNHRKGTILFSLWQKKVLKNAWCTRKTAWYFLILSSKSSIFGLIQSLIPDTKFFTISDTELKLYHIRPTLAIWAILVIGTTKVEDYKRCLNLKRQWSMKMKTLFTLRRSFSETNSKIHAHCKIIIHKL